MRSKTVDRILKSISPERWKEIDDRLNTYIEKVKKYNESLSDEDKFVAIVESEDFNSGIMTNCLISKSFIAPLNIYGYHVTVGDNDDYIFTKQN
jgi:hypothetical protein